jgi:hypothetical protein
MHKPDIEDGYRVFFANTTEDDWLQKWKKIQETNWQLKKFRACVFPWKYVDQKIKTAKDLLSEINKPNAEIIELEDGTEPFVYDKSFFERIKWWEEFLVVWDTIVKENPKVADDFMTKLFRAISQTALKVSYASKLHKPLYNETDLEQFFSIIWHGNNWSNISYRDKLYKKMTELSINDNTKNIVLIKLYTRLLRDFPWLEDYIESICYYTFLYIYHKVPLWPLAVMPKEYMN